MKRYTNGTVVVQERGYVDIDDIRYSNVSEEWLLENGFTLIEETDDLYTPTEEELKYNRLFELEEWLRQHDYIGTKIATGRATIEDYAEEIALMAEYADELEKLRKELS